MLSQTGTFSRIRETRKLTVNTEHNMSLHHIKLTYFKYNVSFANRNVQLRSETILHLFWHSINPFEEPFFLVQIKFWKCNIFSGWEFPFALFNGHKEGFINKPISNMFDATDWISDSIAYEQLKKTRHTFFLKVKQHCLLFVTSLHYSTWQLYFQVCLTISVALEHTPWAPLSQLVHDVGNQWTEA